MPEHERMRPSAREIFERVKQDAREEVDRSSAALAFSGLLAGATLGFSALAYATAEVTLGHHQWVPLLASALYPIGFVAVILGRAQFFTENTLYPIPLVLDERGFLKATLRVWVVVFVANTVGAVVFALLAVETGAFPHGVPDAFSKFGHDIASNPFVHNFWSAIVAGWLMALIAWLVEATEVAIGQALVIWALAFLLAFLALDHSVASTSEVFAATFNGTLSVGRTFGWLGTALLGNILGGVGIVAILNYGQVRAGEGD